MLNILEKYQSLKAPEGAEGGGSSSPPTSSSPASEPSGGSESPQSGTSAETTASPADTTASPPPAGTSAGEAFDFGAIFDGPAEPAEPAPVQPPPQPVPAEPKPPVTPPAPPKPAEAPPVQPTVAAEAPKQAAEPQAPAMDTYDPVALANYLTQNEAQALDFTAQNVFKLTPEEIESLETNVVEAIPKLLAKVFVKSQQNVLAQMGRLVPAMVQRQTEAVKQNTANETKFYERWPDIKAGAHGDLVRKYAAVYRQMHPDVTLEQMVEDLGPMVMMAAKIVPQAVSGQAAAGRAANGRQPPPPPFVPAGTGTAHTQKAQQLSDWEAMFVERE